MKRMGIVGLLLIFCFGLNAQMVYIDPASGGADDEITLYFNAARETKNWWELVQYMCTMV